MCLLVGSEILRDEMLIKSIVNYIENEQGALK